MQAFAAGVHSNILKQLTAWKLSCVTSFHSYSSEYRQSAWIFQRDCHYLDMSILTEIRMKCCHQGTFCVVYTGSSLRIYNRKVAFVTDVKFVSIFSLRVWHVLLLKLLSFWIMKRLSARL